ncbi:MAG: UDP-N-acetylmuramoyl-tripeptide--D-alanyl-D-alanine ligase [Atopobiaceae bacterium]|jgi:UDP-N-acetylmuramoyl-tripeptide--D-alanyl-D-alanine ligase
MVKMRMSVSDICAVTGAHPYVIQGDDVVESVTLDSRQAAAHAAFVAFVGEKTNGNSYASAALEAGSSLVVMTQEPGAQDIACAREHGASLIRAKDDDGEAFMLALAAAWRQKNPQWRVVGVTGSVGKTTTKDMISCALGARYKVHATKGNFNNLLGVPLTLLSCPEDAELVVVEMGMNHAGEISRLTQVVHPHAAVITNIGTSHIGNLGSRENIARAKAEIVLGMQVDPEGMTPELVLSDHDDFTDFIQQSFAAPKGVEVVRVGGCESPFAAQDIVLDESGCAHFTAVTPQGQVSVKLNVAGVHMVHDCLFALAIASHFGVDLSRAAEALSHMSAATMRLEVKEAPGKPRIIDDSYNASPASMAAALDVLASMSCSGRRVAVLGEMGELGDESLRLHGYVGAYAAAKPLDLLAFIGHAEAAHMAEAARTMGFSEDKLEVFASVEDALQALAQVFVPEDLILVKASRSGGLDAFAKGVFDR